MNKEDFDNKLQIKFPTEKYKVVRYGKNSSEDSEIICLSCGRHIIVNTGELFRNRRKHICSKCQYLREDTRRNREIVEQLLYNLNITESSFYMKKNKTNTISVDTVQFFCPKCHCSNTHRVSDILMDHSVRCQYCEGAKKLKNALIYQQELNQVAANRFTLLKEYSDSKTNIRVRCNACNFIRDVKPATFLKHPYCPKCGKIKSKGESQIIKILQSLDVDFEIQKYFREWNWKLHYYDFYLPQLNLIIEYNGIQHYIDSPFFNKLDIQQEIDFQKKQQALNHGINYLVISYQNFNTLSLILNKLLGSTTILKESRPKWAEIETVFNEDEDIVWHSLETERSEINDLT